MDCPWTPTTLSPREDLLLEGRLHLARLEPNPCSSKVPRSRSLPLKVEHSTFVNRPLESSRLRRVPSHSRITSPAIPRHYNGFETRPGLFRLTTNDTARRVTPCPRCLKPQAPIDRPPQVRSPVPLYARSSEQWGRRRSPAEVPPSRAHLERR